jgi:predicted GNAT family N-acyltransferase
MNTLVDLAKINFIADDKELKAEDFLCLAQKVWLGNYSINMTQAALHRTINITAWNEDNILVGCVRILSDGYYFGTIPEILVTPEYQNYGIGRRLMELAWELSPTSLYFGAQHGNEGFFEKLGYVKSMQSYVRKKQRKA